MASMVRGCSIARSQPEGTEEPKQDPQQEDKPDAAEGKDIVDYDPDLDYEGSEPEVEPVTQEQSKVDPNAENAKMERPRSGTLCQRMIPWEV